MKTQSDFRAWSIVKTVPAILELLAKKGEQYTGEDDSCFKNFEEGAVEMGEPKELYLMNLATKQWRVIADWSKRATLLEADNREVRQRIFDVIIYMLILLYMLQAKTEDGNADLHSQTN